MRITVSSPFKFLGWNCEFFYAHGRKANVHKLPASLKGSDMLVYDALRQLGLEVEIRPIPGQDEIEEAAQYDTHFTRKLEKYANSKYGPLEIVGEKLGFVHGWEIDEESGVHGLLQSWGKYGLKHVTWLNTKEKSKKDLGMKYIAVSRQFRSRLAHLLTYIQHGNQPPSDTSTHELYFSPTSLNQRVRHRC